MQKPLLLLLMSICCSCFSVAQNKDSLDTERLAKMISLSEVVLRTDVNVPRFLDRVKNDTTFYKAFKNLHVLGFTSLNDIRILDKKGQQKAGMQSRTMQQRSNGCRNMSIVSETVQGDFYNDDSSYNYYTAELYAGLFFTKGQICGEDNVVAGTNFSTKGKTGMAKNKEQLKMLFFNPGKKIPGIPFMGDRKIDIFDPEVAEYYDFSIDQLEYEGKPAYLFTVAARSDLTSGEKDKIVIDNMITWFDAKTMEIMARNYRLSYDAGVYDFDVTMEVQMTKFGDYLVPKLLRYKGNWDVVFKKRERGVFTATLFNFTN
jgi:hypothetical protein